MTIFPKSRDEWIALPLFPFKAWVVVAFLFYFFVGGYAFGQYAGHGTGDFGLMVMFGYMISVPVLLLAALVQRIFGKRREAMCTALYAIAGLTLALNLYRF